MPPKGPEPYEYMADFEDIAALSNDSYLTPLLEGQVRSRTNVDDPESLALKVDRTFRRYEGIRE